MKKIINIDGKEYTMKSSAYTQFAYKNQTGRSLIQDVKQIMNVVDKLETDFELVDMVSEPLLDMSFVMIQEADEKQVATKEDFIKSIDNLFDDCEWANEVLTLAINPISRQLQN